MIRARNCLRIGLIAAGLSVAAIPLAFAGEPVSITVSLWNKADGTMGITLSADHADGSAVDFHIKNTSADTMHELLITAWRGAADTLPYDANDAQVDEDKLPQLAGIEDMKPGAEAILRLPLKPGRYVLFCNQPGHYKMGMVRVFTMASGSHAG
jgi:uncharacterized cupredoxin-like copper-binding protein